MDEWLSNRNEYQPFFTGKDFESDALQYVNLGTYSTDLEDAMTLGIANVLQTPIVIFTSIETTIFSVMYRYSNSMNLP